MFEPTVRRARDAGLDVRAYVSMCFGDPWEGAGRRSTRWSTSASGSSTSAPRQLSLGDTIGVGTAGHVGRPARARSTRPALADESLAMHFHDTYGQALSNATAALRHGITTFDASRRRARRLPLRQERHRQPRHRGPGVAAHRPRHRARRRPRRAGGDLGVDGRRARPAQPLGRGQGPGRVRPARRAHFPHESRRLPARRGAQDRHDVPPGPARAQQGRAGPARRALPAVAARQPVPPRARPARHAVGRPAGGRRRRVGRADGPGPPAQRDRDRSPTRSSPPPSPTRSGGRWPASRAARCTSSTPPATWPGRSPPSGRRASSTSARSASTASSSQVQAADRTKPSLWFWRVQSLPDVLSRWSRGLPPENGCTS